MTPGPIGINAATFAGTKIAALGGAICATVGLSRLPVSGNYPARVFFKYGNIGPIRGVLNGLRPAVVGLICAASLSFVWLAVWSTETVPKTSGLSVRQPFSSSSWHWWLSAVKLVSSRSSSGRVSWGSSLDSWASCLFKKGDCYASGNTGTDPDFTHCHCSLR